MVFPFMMEIEGKQIVIIGGGTVAFRKFELFRRFGAAVRIVSPELSPLFSGREEEFEYIRGRFRPEFLADAFAVVAASDDSEVNNQAAQYCRERQIPVNAVDDPANCTFIVPAVLQRGDLTIGISTGGKSPALAGRIRMQLEGQFGPDYAPRLELLGRIKALLKASEPDQALRRQCLIQASALETAELQQLLEALEHKYAAVL